MKMEAYLDILKKFLCQLRLTRKEDLIKKEFDIRKKGLEDNFTILTPFEKNQICIDESEPQHAICSLPKLFTLKHSSVHGGGYSIWTKVEIPERMVFGPYEGVMCDFKNSSYSWEVGERRKTTQFMDAGNEFHSNWLRYINYACTEEKQNLIAYQYDGHIYYHTTKTICPETELLVWYGSTYAREIGLGEEMIKRKMYKEKIKSRKIRIFGLILLCDVCNKEYITDERPEADVQFCSVSRHFTCNRSILNQEMHRSEKIFMDNICEKFANNSNTSSHHNNNVNKRPFFCDICEATFTTSNYLKTHQKKHKGEQPLLCSKIYKKKFNCTSDLSYHLEDQTKKPFLDDICKKKVTDFAVRDQRTHMGEKSFTCDICRKECNCKAGLTYHLKAHKGDKPFPCDICQKKFVKQSSLIIHQRIHTCEKPFLCDICKKKFIRFSALKLHKRVHTVEKPFECDICNKKFVQHTHLKSHQGIHAGEKPFTCDICKKEFNSKAGLTYHLKAHKGGKPFACNICKKKFTVQSSLKIHKRIHTGEKPFTCHICRKEFNCKAGLTYHLKAHIGDRPFSCDICKKKFIEHSFLKIHQRIHTGEKPFSCNICKKKFIRFSALKIHKRIHTGEKPFVCGICNKKFAKHRNLKNHKRVHTGEKPFSCDGCKCTFITNDNLKLHQRMHVDVIPNISFSCDICKKEFLTNDDLKHHQKEHINEKPFSCDICREKFVTEDALSYHQRTQAIMI